MQINYKFKSDIEPSDEQLHLLMQEVALEAKKKAQKANEQFLEQLQQLILEGRKQGLSTNPKAE